MELGGTTFALAHQNFKDSETIKNQDAKLKTAYYIFASHKQLKEKNIINKDKINKDLFVDVS